MVFRDLSRGFTSDVRLGANSRSAAMSSIHNPEWTRWLRPASTGLLWRATSAGSGFAWRPIRLLCSGLLHLGREEYHCAGKSAPGAEQEHELARQLQLEPALAGNAISIPANVMIYIGTKRRRVNSQVWLKLNAVFHHLRGEFAEATFAGGRSNTK